MLDLFAFAVGIGVAFWSGWPTTSLVWSLWLSSLVIGYASIVVALWRAGQALREGDLGRSVQEGMGAGSAGSRIVIWGGSLFLLGFFTVHFGGFHFVHSMFLGVLFPVEGSVPKGGFGKGSMYWTVLKENVWFLPLALIAQRKMLFGKPELATAETVKEAKEKLGEGMIAPYKNVVRLHVLIFFFSFAMWFKLPAMLIYLVVYSVYFFPWEKFGAGRSEAA